MAVNTSDITSGPYSGNDVTTEFAYDFRVEDKTQLIVYETDDLGAVTTLTVDTDYTVAGVGVDGGGTITRVAGALPSGYTWYIRSNYQPTQLTSFESQGSFFPSVHEKAFDKLTFLIQQLDDQTQRTFRLPDSYSGGASAELPTPVANRGVKWNSDASALVTTSVDPDEAVDAAAQSVIDAQTAASASAASAASSSGFADASATSAAAAAATYDDFDDRYLGPKATDPTVDNDGDPLLEGAIYWRTTAPKELRFYDGSVWQSMPTLDLDTIVLQDSATGAAQMPTGSTAQQPGSPTEGMLRRNSESGEFEGYDGAQWIDFVTDAATLATKTASVWVNFNGTGTVAIRDDLNVSSITDNGTGDYTINFASALVNANYCVVTAQSDAAVAATSHNRDCPIVSYDVNSVRVNTVYGGSADVLVDAPDVFVAIFGGV